MSAIKRKNSKKVLDQVLGYKQSFVPVRHDFLSSECYRTLSYSAKALYIDLCLQYRVPSRGRDGNNGDLTLGRDFMRKKYGWTAPRTLQRAKDELLERGILLISRMPLRPRDPILYALSTYSIDFCPDRNRQNKHELKPTGEPPDTWKDWKPAA